MKGVPVGVIGSGTMGGGIAQIIGQRGYEVILYDISEEIVTRALTHIRNQLEALAVKGKLKADEVKETLSRIRTATTLQELHGCGLVIEAAPELIEIKKTIFLQLEQHCDKGTILATNTSSFSVTEIAGMLQTHDRVAGLHFFNPAPAMSLVEIVQGLGTSEATMLALQNFVVSLGKNPVQCKDTPGFIVNRIARPFYNEALRIMGDSIAEVEQIDRIMKKAGKFRMGPFEIQDFIGIDINFSTTESLYEGTFGEPRFRPHYYQQRMKQSGRLGKKSGGGYYDYET